MRPWAFIGMNGVVSFIEIREGQWISLDPFVFVLGENKSQMLSCLAACYERGATPTEEEYPYVWGRRLTPVFPDEQITIKKGDI